MTYKITDIQGIGTEFTTRLNTMNIHTTDELLKLAKTDTGMKNLVEKSGIGEVQLRTWLVMADQMRVKGIGPQYAELLLGIGVDSLPKLREHKP